MDELIIECMKNIMPVLIGTGYGLGMAIGAVPVVLSYVIRKVQDLVDIKG